MNPITEGFYLDVQNGHVYEVVWTWDHWSTLKVTPLERLDRSNVQRLTPEQHERLVSLPVAARIVRESAVMI